jgi:hypothetical protein
MLAGFIFKLLPNPEHSVLNFNILLIQSSAQFNEFIFTCVAELHETPSISHKLTTTPCPKNMLKHLKFKSSD